MTEIDRIASDLGADHGALTQLLAGIAQGRKVDTVGVVKNVIARIGSYRDALGAVGRELAERREGDSGVNLGSEEALRTVESRETDQGEAPRQTPAGTTRP